MTIERPMFPPRETVPDRYSFLAPIALNPAEAAAPPPKPARLDRRGVLCGLVATASLPSPAAAVALACRPCEPDAVFAAIENFRRAETVFDQVEADSEAALERGELSNVERWEIQDRYRNEVLWPALDDLISTPPATMTGLAALLAFIRECGGVVDFIGEQWLPTFERSIECSVCALAGLPAPALSIHLQGQGGEHAA
ncbi:hypothetical protein [Bradyrhizobium sp. LA7.1]|uniref:hypothetical protein n=1 Tax=Bradyrhizobium sp. LA7.1 TaxID=3156324 RepID=UPI00339B39E9